MRNGLVLCASGAPRRVWLRAGAGILVAGLALAGGHAEAQAPGNAAAKPGLQADFDAASAAAADGKCAEAEPIFARLMVDPRVKPGSLPAAMIAVRRGLCHLLSADAEQGEAWIKAGLPGVEAAGPAMATDTFNGWYGLARIAVIRYDHDGAVTAYSHALAVPGMDTRVSALTGLANVTAFDGDGAALGLADRALASLAQDTAKNPGKNPDRNKQEAYIHAIRVRILMNLGRFAEADKEGAAAVALAGGLTTTKVSQSDVELRSDAAEAALLNNRQDRARELLAYTGAGHIAESPFVSASLMTLPDCDETIGLRATDSAVVEFAIGSDGAVEGAQTVFTRGNYATARTFAEAVQHWAWQPETVAKLPPFYRSLIRVELRCSRSGGGLPGVWSVFDKRLSGWVGPATWLDRDLSRAAQAAALRQHASVLEAGGDRVGAGVLLLRALDYDPVTRADAVTQADKAVALLADADPAHRASALAVRALMTVRRARVQMNAGVKTSTGTAPLLFDAARDPAIAADALAQDTLLLAGLTAQRVGAFSAIDVQALHQVADDTRLDAASPLRQIALLRLASMAAHDRHPDEAQALFARTGLDSEQCSLIGDIPRVRVDASDNDFPVDALRMGFEGWVKEEYDIGADGHTVAPRAVIAYPPFVFIDGATKIIHNMRYDPSFRPSATLACSAKSETIKFAVPSLHTR